MKKVLAVAAGLLAVTAAGCGKTPPTLAGGEPVAYWVEALHGPDVKLRKKAAFKLGNVGPADPAALPALIGALKDPAPTVRYEAVLALVKFGPAAREALPVLGEMERHDRDRAVRCGAAAALAKIRGDG
jgi:HEAT repeat protein